MTADELRAMPRKDREALATRLLWIVQVHAESTPNSWAARSLEWAIQSLRDNPPIASLAAPSAPPTGAVQAPPTHHPHPDAGPGSALMESRAAAAG